jgi:2-haloacid dehalogenase
VVPGLQRLQAAGYRLAALTNSSQEAMTNKLTSAGLAPFFEEMVSVDSVQKFKPAHEVYHFAAKRLGIAPSDMLMVAAHDWDVTGAIRAGCQGAYIARAGQVVAESSENAHYIAVDLIDLANQLS